MLNSIFIVGTGRSGTHFTCRSISGFKNIFDPQTGKENVPVLKQIATSAIHHQSYPQIAKSYYSDIKSNLKNDSIFIDQHHPNIFYCGISMQKIRCKQIPKLVQYLFQISSWV